MKKLKKALFSLVMILFYANNAYATTTGTYVASDATADSGKLLLLLVAGFLIAIVLFLGYRMDKNEAQEKRKEQIIEKNSSDKGSVYSNKNVSVSEVEDLQDYEREYKKASEQTAVIEINYPEMQEEIEEAIPRIREKEIEKTYTPNISVEENINTSSESTMVIDTNAIKGMIEEEEEVILPSDTVKRYTRKKEEVKEEKEEKPKATKKATKTTSKTSKVSSDKTKKTTTAKKSTKTTKKATEEKTKVAKKTTSKKTTDTAKKTPSKKTTKTTKKETEVKTKTTKKATTKK